MGNYTAALDEYEAALRVLIGYSNNRWQERVKDVALQESTSAIQQAKVTWHRSNRNRIATVPSGYTTLFGRLDANRVLVECGRVDNAEFRQVDVAEIMRCSSLAIFRRYRILGPIAKYSPLTTELIAALAGQHRVWTMEPGTYWPSTLSHRQPVQRQRQLDSRPKSQRSGPYTDSHRLVGTCPCQLRRRKCCRGKKPCFGSIRFGGYLSTAGLDGRVNGVGDNSPPA